MTKTLPNNASNAGRPRRAYRRSFDIAQPTQKASAPPESLTEAQATLDAVIADLDLQAEAAHVFEADPFLRAICEGYVQHLGLAPVDPLTNRAVIHTALMSAFLAFHKPGAPASHGPRRFCSALINATTQLATVAFVRTSTGETWAPFGRVPLPRWLAKGGAYTTQTAVALEPPIEFRRRLAKRFITQDQLNELGETYDVLARAPA